MTPAWKHPRHGAGRSHPSPIRQSRSATSTSATHRRRSLRRRAGPAVRKVRRSHQRVTASCRDRLRRCTIGPALPATRCRRRDAGSARSRRLPFPPPRRPGLSLRPGRRAPSPADRVRRWNLWGYRPADGPTSGCHPVTGPRSELPWGRLDWTVRHCRVRAWRAADPSSAERPRRTLLRPAAGYWSCLNSRAALLGTKRLLIGQFVVLVDVTDRHVRSVEVGDGEAEQRPVLDQSVDDPLLDPFDAWFVDAGVADCVHRYPAVTDAAGVLDTGVGLVDHALVFVAPEPCTDPAVVQQGRQLVAQ